MKMTVASLGLTLLAATVTACCGMGGTALTIMICGTIAVALIAEKEKKK